MTAVSARSIPLTASLQDDRRGRRLHSLDGLRGVAAAIVVLHHLGLALQPVLAGTIGWAVLTRTPLTFLIGGHQAVLVFFVLSGLVITAQPLGDARFSWTGFAASRFVRLYLPAAAAVLLGVGLVASVHRDPATMPAGSWMAYSHATTVDPNAIINELTLMWDSPVYDNVLWSLRWEVIFSLLLPVYAIAAHLLRRRPALGIVLCLAVCGFGAAINVQAVYIPPLFLIGALLSGPGTTRPPGTTAPLHHLAWTAASVLSMLLLVAPLLVDGPAVLGPDAPGIAKAVEPIGAAGIVLCTLRWAVLRRILELRPAQFLGRISFSLYLVHVPILATVAYGVGLGHWKLVLIGTLVASSAAAVVFHRLVERPSHLLARRAGRAAAAAFPAAPAAASRSGDLRPARRPQVASTVHEVVLEPAAPLPRRA